MKLFSSRNYPTLWYAYQPGTGWLMFPNEAGGWHKRRPARGMDPIDVREVPVEMAAGTGILCPVEEAETAYPEAA